MKIYKTPLSKIEEICAYFRDPANMPLVTVASDKTHYAWQHIAIFAQMRAVSVPCADMGGDPDKPNLAMTMYRMVSDSDTKKYYYDNIWDPSVFWADLTSADLGEGAKPSKLLVSGKSDLAGDVTAQFEPAEPYAYIS